ncbi:MAG: hypothetical protein PF689_12440 [Deltaproteobacteria bacterium]|nr:hypothetical protein [Deltaproteobacteria bacterium]
MPNFLFNPLTDPLDLFIFEGDLLAEDGGLAALSVLTEPEVSFSSFDVILLSPGVSDLSDFLSEILVFEDFEDEEELGDLSSRLQAKDRDKTRITMDIKLVDFMIVPF